MDTDVPEPSAPATPRPQGKAVYLDVDGTLASTTLIGALQWMMKRYLGGGLFRLWQLGLLVKAPYWWILRAVNPYRFNTSVCYEYAGMDADDTRELSETFFRAYVKPRIFPQAVKKVRELSALGYQVVLVTGELDFLMEPLARDLKAALIAPRLVELNGDFTGAMDGGALIEERKANAVRAHAEENGIDLKQSFAYGNDGDDLAMLECVGNAVAVNPSRHLNAFARRHQWSVELWRRN